MAGKDGAAETQAEAWPVSKAARELQDQGLRSPLETLHTNTRLTDMHVFSLHLDCIVQNQSPYE